MTVINPASLGTLGISVSDEITGDGTEQDYTHELGRTPTVVLVTITDNNGGNGVVAEGTHTSSVTKVTVTNGAKYKILAM